MPKKNYKMNYKIPSNIEPRAKDYMKKVIDYLEKADKLNDVDTAGLNMLAYNYNIFLKAQEDIEQNGLIATGSRGNTIPNPSIKIELDAQVQCLKIMEKYFLTPKDRQKMKNDIETNESPLMEFIKKDKED